MSMCLTVVRELIYCFIVQDTYHHDFEKCEYLVLLANTKETCSHITKFGYFDLKSTYLNLYKVLKEFRSKERWSFGKHLKTV